MSTKILSLKEDSNLQPVTALWQRYQTQDTPYRFKAANLGEAQEWQQRTRPALSQAVGFQDFPPSLAAAELLESVDCGDYLRHKIILHTTPHTSMPVFLLLPKAVQPPYPVVIAFHGHGYGVKDIVGLWENGEERQLPDGYHKDFGVALCRAGFAVAAPEISGFGERLNDYTHLNTTIGAPVPYTCDHTAKLAFHLGGSLVGLRVLDARRLVDYLQTRPDLDATRLGAMGISGGGMNTFFATCLDERIRACVVSGYFSTFKDSILAMHHCTCNFVPGLWQFGEMHDLAGLIAPRPMLVEAGTYDPLFPIQAVREGVERARQVYAAFGAQEQLETDIFEGRHQISGARAYDFLKEKLSA